MQQVSLQTSNITAASTALILDKLTSHVYSSLAGFTPNAQSHAKQHATNLCKATPSCAMSRTLVFGGRGFVGAVPTPGFHADHADAYARRHGCIT